MIIRQHTEEYNFCGDTETGMTMRWGADINDNPISAPWPELADISISNYCTKGCDFCYKNSTADGNFLSVKDYEFVLDNLCNSSLGKVFQVALGGGEPLEHPEFLDIIDITVKKGIVPNFTTNGIHLTAEIVQAIEHKVGAVAISVGSVEDIRLDKLLLLKEGKIKTNLHYVLNDGNIEQAIEMLQGKYNDQLEDVNGLIFLTYKPTGRAGDDRCLKMDYRLKQFLSLVDGNKCAARIGFDACFVPLLLHYTDINADYVDSCECGFFSVYIDENMTVKSCSFCNSDKYVFNLRDYSFEDIWKNKFLGYREEILDTLCETDCKNIHNCRGACPYYNSLQFCYQSDSSSKTRY